MSEKRDLVADTVCSNLELEVGGSTVSLPDVDAREMIQTLVAIRKEIIDRKAFNYEFEWNNATYELTSKSTIQVYGENGNDTVRATLYINNGSEQKLTYVIYRHHATKKYTLQAIVNPTSLVAGNNVSPIIVNGAAEGSYREAFRLYRAPFVFLLVVLKKWGFRASNELRSSLKRGHISVSNTQWAFYLQSENKVADLAVLRRMYHQLSIDDDGSRVYLCQYLGLSPFVDPDMIEYSFMLQKKESRGERKTATFSVGIYDKKVQMATKKRLGELSPEQQKMLDNHLRVDITFHRPQLEKMILEAKNRVLKLSQKTNYETFLCRYKEFLRRCDNTTIDAYTVSRAMEVLSLVEGEDGSLSLGKFSAYLVERILFGELRLNHLLKYSNLVDPGNMSAKEQEVYDIWKEGNYDTSQSFASAVDGKVSCTKKYLYSAIKSLRENHGIVVDVPYALQRQLSVLDSVYSLTPKEQEELLCTKDGDRAIRLLSSSKKRSRGRRDTLALTIIKAARVSTLTSYGK